MIGIAQASCKDVKDSSHLGSLRHWRALWMLDLPLHCQGAREFRRPPWWVFACPSQNLPCFLYICIVFLPMFFLAGVSKFLFVPLAEAVVFAMLASYVLSRTLVP